MASSYNVHIESIVEPTLHGRPDIQNVCLYAFQSVLLELLAATPASSVPFGDYFSLPTVAGEYTYRFSVPMLGEMGVCSKHGDFSRKITAENLSVIKTECMNHEPMSSSEIFSSVHNFSGNPTNDRVWIYNPEGLALNKILSNQEPDDNGIVVGFTTYDMIEIDGMACWIPYYYSFKQDLISQCPQCLPITAKPRKKVDKDKKTALDQIQAP